MQQFAHFNPFSECTPSLRNRKILLDRAWAYATTVCVDVGDNEEKINTFARGVLENPSGPHMLDVGIAICSPLDRFSRKAGREIASSKLKPTKVACPSFYFPEEEIYDVEVTVYIPTGLRCPQMCDIKLRRGKHTNRWHLVSQGASDL